jgi:3-hydroxyacyl-CoA dehydrogenase, NAD binding domain
MLVRQHAVLFILELKTLSFHPFQVYDLDVWLWRIVNVELVVVFTWLVIFWTPVILWIPAPFKELSCCLSSAFTSSNAPSYLPDLCPTPCRAPASPYLTLPYLTPVLPMTSIRFSWKGLMGHGIAQIAAHAGFQVMAIEASDAALNIGITRYCKAVAVMLWRERHQYKTTWTQFIFHGDLHDWDAKWHSSSCWLLLPWFTSVCLSVCLSVSTPNSIINSYSLQNTEIFGQSYFERCREIGEKWGSLMLTYDFIFYLSALHYPPLHWQ